jgi:conjugative transposon TraK protein
MSHHLQTLDRTFQQIRLYCFLWFIGCGALCLFLMTRTFSILEKADRRIYILSGGKVLDAFASDRRDNLDVEQRDHIRTFHEDFFGLDPDEKVINTHINRALYLADGSAKLLYDNLKESGYYTGIISGNISQQIRVDSIRLEADKGLTRFRCWAVMTIIRPTSTVTRSLITEGWLRPVTRSDNNPHGFLIEKWRTLENKDLKIDIR